MEIVQALAEVFVLVGLKGDAKPEKHEMFVLIKWIIGKYKNLTTRELVIAFELSLSGQFLVETRHFNNFSVAYMSRIVNSYLEERKRSYKKIQLEKEKESLANKEMTEEQINISNKVFDRNTIYKSFLVYKKNRVVDFGIVPVSHVYKNLEERHNLFNLTDEKKRIIYLENKDVLMVELKNNSTKKSTSTREMNQKKVILRVLQGEDKGSLKKMVQNKCHLSMIESLFKGWDVKNVDVELELKIK